MQNPRMNKLLALLAALLLCSCGGGGGGGTELPAPTSAGPLIRYQGSYLDQFDSTRTPSRANTLTLRAVPGETSISANPVARVEVRNGSTGPFVLTAPNSTDATGRPQYLFDFGQNGPGCVVIGTSTRGGPLCAPRQITITVTDTTGFAFTKYFVPCSQQQCDFGAFFDYGTTAVQFSMTSSAPTTGVASRTSRSGYEDTLLFTEQTFSATLPAADGNGLRLGSTLGPPPDGTRVRTRIDAGGGAFAESTIVAQANRAWPDVFLECCGPRPAGMEVVDIVLSTSGFLPVTRPTDTYTYSFRITDPATGTVVGSQSDTIYGQARFPLRVRRGHVIEMEVTPNVPELVASATTVLGSVGSVATQAQSNEPGTPARLKVYCCSP